MTVNTIDKTIDADLLRSVHLFASLSEAHLPSVVAAAALRPVPARTVLFAEGDRLDSLHIVVKGAVELYSEHSGRRFTVAVVRALRPLALASIMVEHNPLSARALEPSELVVVPAPLVVELFGRDPAFALAVAHELAGACHELIDDFRSHRLRTTTERVANWMLRCDESTGRTGRFVIPYDKRVLASYLGMAPEHLSRSFSALASAGVVVSGRRIMFSDRAALALAAGIEGPDPACNAEAAAPRSASAADRMVAGR
jgi:CRP/FNR family transcriptional regulator, transcriptional activator FtrB